jgi:MEMO1 family protein
MSLVFSAIVPHPPLLIPAIGKDNIKLLYSTQAAYQNLAKKLKEHEPETIIVISPHGNCQTAAFTMNQSPQFTASFAEFGDLATKKTYQGDIGLTHKIKESLETSEPLQLISEQKIDYGVSVPLHYLAAELPNIKIIPLYYSGLDQAAHFKFGQSFGKEIVYNKNKIAVIVSGDLSHCLTKNAPAKYSAKGKKFDQKVIEALQEKKTQDLVNLDEKLVKAAQQCGLKAILILLGILDGVHYKPKQLSYEYPFGVGYLVMNFEL